ncbi:hypothetical protein GCM10028808_56230 [Spirosoma migulaei]
MLTDKVQGGIGQYIGDEPFGSYHPVVMLQVGIEVIIPMARTKAQKLIESLTVGVFGGMFPVMPFAKTAGGIPVLAEYLGQSEFRATHAFPALGDRNRTRTEVVAAREQAGAGGGAKRADEEVIEPSSAAGQLVEIGCFDKSISM